MINDNRFLTPLSLSLKGQNPKEISHTHKDKEFESTIATYIDTLIEEEKESFQPGIESIEVHTKRMSEQIRDTLIQFLHCYQRGYQVISEALTTLQIEIPSPNIEKIDSFEDPKAFIEALNRNEETYQLLGFSPDAMNTFYTGARHLIKEQDFKNGCNAFYFLTTLAPKNAPFWLGLAICYTEQKDRESALDATLRSITCNPKMKEGYLHALHLYKQKDSIEQANALCEKGISLAEGFPEESWAQELKVLLEEAKPYIQGN
jgi:tetratricopeptide (TPR) repeat protein